MTPAMVVNDEFQKELVDPGIRYFKIILFLATDTLSKKTRIILEFLLLRL